jgi:hypothetical protein
MGTANFRSMKEFDLYVLEDKYLYLTNEDTGELDYDSVDEALLDEINWDIKKLNKSFEYYEIQLLDGYYSGVQLYVNKIYEPAMASELEKEKELMKATLEKLASNMGFIKLQVVGRFNNGEVWYEKASK